MVRGQSHGKLLIRNANGQALAYVYFEDESGLAHGDETAQA